MKIVFTYTYTRGSTCSRLVRIFEIAEMRKREHFYCFLRFFFFWIFSTKKKGVNSTLPQGPSFVVAVGFDFARTPSFRLCSRCGVDCLHRVVQPDVGRL